LIVLDFKQTDSLVSSLLLNPSEVYPSRQETVEFGQTAS